jgi:hypothetical protein
MRILQQQQRSNLQVNAAYFNVFYAPIVTTFSASSWSRSSSYFYYFIAMHCLACTMTLKIEKKLKKLNCERQ